MLQTLHKISPPLFRVTMRLAKYGARSLVRPVYEQCRLLGIAPPAGNPLFEGQFSPYGTLALFPDRFATPQADWPARTTTTGFAFYRHDTADAPVRARLESFLAGGEPPLVFALGSSAVEIARDFFSIAARIARQLRRRAVLVAGSRATEIAAAADDPALLVIDYVDYETLFARASLIVHQGGIGTTAQATRAGRPMLIVPFGFDQFDNAKHMVRMGAARRVRRQDFTVERTAPLIADMLADTVLARAAAESGKFLTAQDGMAGACDTVEACIGS
jgi:UDP:flavonoid glycosyltransferase YjiC (YdhE family)